MMEGPSTNAEKQQIEGVRLYIFYKGRGLSKRQLLLSFPVLKKESERERELYLLIIIILLLFLKREIFWAIFDHGCGIK